MGREEMTILWLIFSFLTFAIGYGIGLIFHNRHAFELMDIIEDLQELLADMEELGFTKFEGNLKFDEQFNFLIKEMQERDFSSNDEMHNPNQQED
jgi:flagellar motor component MotA